jgi:hypothetical protein
MNTNVFLPPAATEASLSCSKRIFLAGSIEMGKADNWQHMLTELCRTQYPDKEVCFYNPRREDWDSGWEQQMSNPQFHEQVSWEMNHLERATDILFYFQPGTMSPISLLELGLHARDKKACVVCPDGFWRKGNVDIVCERFGIPWFATADAALQYIMQR